MLHSTTRARALDDRLQRRRRRRTDLALALVWWPVAVVLAFTYFAVVMRNYRGKVRPTEGNEASS